MSFASDTRVLRRVILFMLETHIIMSSLIFHIILILVFRLVLTLVLCLTLLLVLCLFYLINLTIAHLVLLHERTTLCPDTLVTVHVIIVAIVSCVCLVFLLEDITHPEPRHLDGPCFLRRGSRPTGSSGEVLKTVKTPSDRMVKCWISKIYLTNPSTEPSTISRPM
jgi:membrane protein implicated in regulation of membrane protease activity